MLYEYSHIKVLTHSEKKLPMVGVTVKVRITPISMNWSGECACLYVGRDNFNRGIDSRTNEDREKDVVPVRIQWGLYFKINCIKFCFLCTSEVCFKRTDKLILVTCYKKLVFGCPGDLSLDSNIESKTLNNTFLNIVEISNKLKMNFIKMQNLVVISTQKKDNFKLTGKTS